MAWLFERRGAAHRQSSPDAGDRQVSFIGGFHEAAGRDAYLAAYHAALAYINLHDRDAPKTHRGMHNRFTLFAKDDPRIKHAFVAFLSRAIVIKNSADYSTASDVTRTEADDTIAIATEFTDVIEAIVLRVGT